jgi:hypothetical protein
MKGLKAVQEFSHVYIIQASCLQEFVLCGEELLA